MTAGASQEGPQEGPGDTVGESYARRLRERESVWWKRALDVQAPYRVRLRRHRLGRTLDVGCGIGRNLATLEPGSLGVDHNPHSVAVAVERGLAALTTQEWQASDERRPGAFDALLLAHVLEHMDHASAVALLEEYLPHVRPGGRVLMICPQERGYASDPTHVSFLDGDDLVSLAREVGLEPTPWRSFPLPRRAGRIFTHNELSVLAVRPG